MSSTSAASSPRLNPLDGHGFVPLAGEDEAVGWQPGRSPQPADVKAAVGAFPTGVAVLTSRAGGDPVGMTVSSFTSVSLDPPLVLVCLDRRAAALPAFKVGAPIGINILADHQKSLAMAFVRPFDDRFKGVTVLRGPNDVPLLEDAAAWLSGHVARIYEGGDHLIVLCRLHAVHTGDRFPLLYHAGTMHSWPAPGHESGAVGR